MKIWHMAGHWKLQNLRKMKKLVTEIHADSVYGNRPRLAEAASGLLTSTEREEAGVMTANRHGASFWGTEPFSH